VAIVLAFAATYRGSGVDDEKAALLRRLRKVVIIIAYVVGLGGFAHIIAGSVEVLYLVTTGALSWGGYFARFFARHSPETSSGGVLLVAILNHAQVTAGSEAG
jgi:formate/nitrite transporter FocA (FNT family)